MTLFQGRAFGHHLLSTGPIFFYGVIFYLFTNLIDGPIRFVLSSIGLEVLLYSRDLVLLLILGLVFIDAILWSKIDKLFYKIMIVLVFYGVIGYVYVANIPQILFGFKILLPFLTGVVCYKYFITNIPLTTKFFRIFLLIAMIGLYANSFFRFPWQGLFYNINGVSIEGGFDRSTFGLFRNTGFSRTNFEGATQVLLLSLFMVAFLNGKLSRFIIWIAAGGAIALTTTKGIIVVYLLLSIFLLTYFHSRYKIYQKLLVVPLAFMILVPLLTIDFNFDKSDPIQVTILASFGDRIINAWPPIFENVKVNGNVLTGRGIGGTGASEYYFSDVIHGAPDNMFVFLYAWFGFLCIPYLLFTLFKAQYLDIGREKRDFYFYLLFMSILFYGITANVVESTFFGFFLGMTLRHLHALSFRKRLSSRALKNSLKRSRVSL